MVKGVVGDEGRLSLAEERVAGSGIAAEVGLLIGKLSRESERGFIFELVATPPNDAGQPPCSLNAAADKNNSNKKNNSSSSSSSCLAIDSEWVAEHARQVSRMMAGGINVVGVYVWAPESAFKNSTLALTQTIKGVATAAPLSETSSDDRLLVHICCSPRRWVCRTCSLASNVTSTTLRPCDFKMGMLLNSLQAFRCIYNFDLRLPVFTENLLDGNTLNDILQDGVSIHAKELKGALAMIDGVLVNVNEDGPCASDDVHDVELLLPFLKEGSLEACSQNDVVGVLAFSGTVCSYSYLNSKEPVSQAVADIKEDITRSLRSRLEIITDEAEREMAAASGDHLETNSEMSGSKSVNQILKPLRKEIILPFPRRVFIPWLAGSFVCDYLLPSETFEVVKDHFVELLSMEAPADALLVEPEKELPNRSIGAFWVVVAPSYQASDSAFTSKNKTEAVKSDANKISTANFNAIFAGFVLLIAIILGSLLYARN